MEAEAAGRKNYTWMIKCVGDTYWILAIQNNNYNVKIKYM